MTHHPPIPDDADQVVILGAGRSVRGALPSAIVAIDEHGRVMDWLLAAFAALGRPRVCFVAGYHADHVVERYPEVRVVLNREWDTTGPVQSLGLAPLDTDRQTWVCYSDVVFRPSAVMALRDTPGDVVLAIDSHWRDRYARRGRADLDRAEKVRTSGGRVQEIGACVATTAADAEFAGLIRLSPAGASAVAATVQSGVLAPSASLPDLITHLLQLDLRVAIVDLRGEWAELDARQDLARFVLGTKAESLARLSRMNHGGTIGELVSFTRGEWVSRRDDLIGQILDDIPGERLIVRSSALSEDGWLESAAGRHTSVARVERASAAIAEAVDTVFASYRSDHLDHQILVQEMLQHVAVSGVVMTRTPTIAAPYYVLNFDDRGAGTDAVTRGGDARTIFVHREAAQRCELPAPLRNVLATVQNLETLVAHDSLDIEFAVTSDGRVHILQVRPIAVAHVEPIDDAAVGRAVDRARRFLVERSPTPLNLVGRATRYSVMSDWNPAEILGTKPKRLAFSLYRHLITDDVWAQQRAEYGYRDVRPCPLLVDVAGHPYVDVRASFSSFVPAALPDDLAGRLVDAYIERLAAHPHLHDKVEFDILFTCLTVDFEFQVATRLHPAGFTSAECAVLRDALCVLTEAGLTRTVDDAARLPGIDAAIARVLGAVLPPLDKAFYLIDVARRLATLTFAHLARSAFVVTSLLRSLQSVGALTSAELAGFLASIETVLGRMLTDGRRTHRGELAWDAFVEAYGHLRPGTYDITSPCYRAAAEQYLGPVVERAGTSPRTSGPGVMERWAAPTRRAIAGALRQVGLGPDVDRFAAVARMAIAGREEGKFIFTKALSAALECVADFGAEHGFSRAELAHIGIRDLMSCRDVIGDPRDFLACRVREGRDANQVSQAMCLPGQIATEADLICFERDAAEPNFVTQRIVEADVVARGLSPDAKVNGRIVLIPNADPGHDWLLAREIAGLITMYGGANSHMAVRAAELDLPAAIGVGESLYLDLEAATTIRLDCAAHLLTVVH